MLYHITEIKSEKTRKIPENQFINLLQKSCLPSACMRMYVDCFSLSLCSFSFLYNCNLNLIFFMFAEAFFDSECLNISLYIYNIINIYVTTRFYFYFFIFYFSVWFVGCVRFLVPPSKPNQSLGSFNPPLVSIILPLSPPPDNIYIYIQYQLFILKKTTNENDCVYWCLLYNDGQC